MCYQLTNTCYLEGSTLDHLTKSFKILTSYLFQRSLNNARSADTNVNDSVCFCHTMESTCHKRVIIRCITEYNQLRTSQGILIFGSFRCFQNDLTHQLNSIHIDTCTCRSNIYRTADTLCLRHSLWDRFDQKSLSRSHSLAYQCRIPPIKFTPTTLAALSRVSAIVTKSSFVLHAAPPINAIGVTEILLFTIGIPYSPEIASPVDTRSFAQGCDSFL